MDVPHTRGVEHHAPAHRFGSIVRQHTADGCSVALLGMPDDTGVRMNGGRPGASGGPGAIRAALAAYGTSDPSGWAWPGVLDAGDVEPAKTLEETHARVRAASAALLEAGLVPIGLGGGHDLTCALAGPMCERAGGKAVGVYFDAHLDVRSEPGSGMSFRTLVEECGVRELHVHGLDPAVNSAEHMHWFASHGGRVDPFEPGDPWPEGELFVSFDLDAIDAGHAPGVSAPNPCGMDPRTAVRWCESAGRCERVRCFDIVELAPSLDENGRTARLAARLLLAFLQGFAGRPRR